ncbi:N-acetylmuramoyl-L-alanine amidase [Enterococcus sp.]|uniref:N-acetylmuramoyl-L-alanine amidase n=1 Tax=Enterococcus sp. TaxID=35783 RepID=UPI0028974161|nr:N-acetylmuramoyl-L-alanine amidase [Enterococcus sp.]
MSYNNSTSHRGHNAKTPGASGNGLKEHEVAQTIHEKFRDVTKAVDCTDDSGATANANLVNIGNKMNAVGKSWHVSHHLNAFNGTANGFEVWHMAGNAEAKKLAEDICAAVCAATGWANRGAKATTSLYVIRASVGSAILVEWGFIDSKKDMDILADKMDVAINAMLKVMGYGSISGSASSGSSSSNTSTSTFDINNYHTTKFSQIRLVKADWAYKEVSLKTKDGTARVPKGTILTVTGLEYSGKYPRFKLKSGLYITTRKDTVEEYKASSGSSSSSNTAAKLKGSDLPSKGKYTFATNTNIRAAASTSSASVGLYKKGESVTYDKKVTAGGYVWLSWIGASGNRRYSAVV